MSPWFAAAHDEAVRLDPNVATGVEYTIAHLRDGVQKAAQLTSPRVGFLDGIFPAIALGDPRNAREVLNSVSTEQVPPAFLRSFDAISAFLNRPVADAIPVIEEAIAAHVDPEALFLFGIMLTRLGIAERGLDVVRDAVQAGYTPASTLTGNRAFDAVRGQAAFKAIEADAWRRVQMIQVKFEAAGGPEMLGLPAPTRLG